MNKKQINVVQIFHQQLSELHETFSEIDIEFLKKLPYCRKNLLSIANFCYSQLAYKVISRILRDQDVKLWSDETYKKNFIMYTQEYDFCNLKFLNFFLSFFNPLYLCIKRKIENSIEKQYHEDNIVNKSYKIIQVKKWIINLYNLIALQLFGLDISCSSLKETEECNNTNICEPLCLKYSHSKCDNIVGNTIKLFVNPLYYENEGLFDKILESLVLLEDKVIMFVDYTYSINKNYQSEYNWSKMNAYERYKKILNYVAGIYFTNTEDVNFDKYKEEIEPYIIYNKEEYYKVMEAWNKNKEVIKLR